MPDNDNDEMIGMALKVVIMLALVGAVSLIALGVAGDELVRYFYG